MTNLLMLSFPLPHHQQDWRKSTCPPGSHLPCGTISTIYTRAGRWCIGCINHTLCRGHSARGVARKAGKHCYGSLLCALCYRKHFYGKHCYGKHYYRSLDRGHYHHQPWDIWSQLKLESVVGSDHNNSSRCKIAKDSDVRNFRGLEGGGGKYLCIVQGGGGFSQLFIDLPQLVPIKKT